MTQCTPTSTLLERIGDEITRRAVALHDELGLPRSCVDRWVHDQRADERRDKPWRDLMDFLHNPPPPNQALIDLMRRAAPWETK